MRIGILGGTFNPIHRAHIQMARMAQECMALDRVLLMVAADPPHKRVAGAVDGAHRLRMAELAAAPFSNVAACDMELKRAGRSYTFDTLTELTQRYPGAELFWIVGSDMLLDLPNWHRVDELLRLAGIIALPRQGEAHADTAAAEALRQTFGARVALLDRAVDRMSSTEIRERVFRALPVQALVEPAVERYFYEEGLYLPDAVDALRSKMQRRLSPKRYRHVMGAVRQAAALSERYVGEAAPEERAGLFERARLAALLHDCAKQLDERRLSVLSGDDTPGAERVLHAFAGAVMAKMAYGVRDETVLRAIRLHTTGEANMTVLERIVYLADLTEPERRYPGVENYRAHLEPDSGTAMRFALAGTIGRLRAEGAPVHPASLRAEQYFRQYQQNEHSN